jgi:hypothetical protein
LCTTDRNRLGGEHEAEGLDRTETETRELTLGLSNGEDRHIIDGRDESTNKRALRGTQQRAEMRGRSAGSDGRDKHALSSGIGAKADTKVRRVAVDLEGFVNFM